MSSKERWLKLKNSEIWDMEQVLYYQNWTYEINLGKNKKWIMSNCVHQQSTRQLTADKRGCWLMNTAWHYIICSILCTSQTDSWLDVWITPRQTDTCTQGSILFNPPHGEPSLINQYNQPLYCSWPPQQQCLCNNIGFCDYSRKPSKVKNVSDIVHLLNSTRKDYMSILQPVSRFSLELAV